VLTEPEAFIHWYEVFPRHEAREDAWRKLDPDPALIQTIMSATVQYAAAKADTEKKFIKTPAAWLNGKRWQDEFEGHTNGHAKPAEVPTPRGDLTYADG
jgi:hypothetical protein